jgi:hypothetical protein
MQILLWKLIWEPDRTERPPLHDLRNVGPGFGGTANDRWVRHRWVHLIVYFRALVTRAVDVEFPVGMAQGTELLRHFVEHNTVGSE